MPAKVLAAFKKGEDTIVTCNDAARNLSRSDSIFVRELNIEVFNPNTDDLINLTDLHEMSILHCLKIRYCNDSIYTNISSILISINPHKAIPLYSPQVLSMYKASNVFNLPPHIFGIASNAYRSMLDEKKNQSVIISGESGEMLFAMLCLFYLSGICLLKFLPA